MIRKIYPQILAKPVILIYLLPIVVLIPFIFLYGFRVPIMDEWPIAVIFENIATGKAGLIDFIEIYNDHRYFFLRLIIVPLAFLSGWNKIYEMLISLIFAIANLVLIIKISQQQNPKIYSSKQFHTVNGLSCLIMFSLIQYQNWLWGLQLGVFLVNLCVTVSLLILSLNQKFCERQRLLFAALPIIIASFTMAQGIISWLAILPSVFLMGKNPKTGLKYALIWLGLFGVTTIVYSWGYNSDNPTRFNIAFFIEYPIFCWQFFLIMLGAPLAQYSTQLANLLGIIVFFSFIVAIIRGWQTRGLEFLRIIAPWIGLGLFALLFAIITTFGRAEAALILNQGLDFALASRYTTNSLLLWIAVLQIGLYFLSQDINITRWKWKLSSVAILIIFLTGINSVYAIEQGAKNYRKVSEDTQNCLKVLQVLDDRVPICWNWFEILQSHDITRQRTSILNDLGMINSPDIKFTDRKANYGSFVWDNSQNVFPLSHNNGWIMLNGKLKINAPFPKTNSPYLFILSRENQPSVISFIETDPKLLTHRKQLKFQIAVPTLVFKFYQKTPIKAWIKNPNTQELIALAGETQITVTPDNVPNPRFNRQPQQVYGYITVTPNPLILNPTDVFNLDGWAGFGDRDKQPDQVYFSYGDENFFFAQTEINLDTPHVVKHFNSDRYRRSGWLTELSAQDLPLGETIIRAWVYDPDAEEFITLNNRFPVFVRAQDSDRIP